MFVLIANLIFYMRYKILFLIILLSAMLPGCDSREEQPVKKTEEISQPTNDWPSGRNDTTRLIISVDDSIGMRWNDDNLQIFTEPQKNFHYIQELEREVNNGGFSQYFFNSSGDYAHETIVALRSIGANRTSDILQKAMNEFPDHSVPKNRDLREALIRTIEKKASPVWEELTQEYFSYPHNLDSLCVAYITKYKDDFKKWIPETYNLLK